MLGQSPKLAAAVAGLALLTAGCGDRPVRPGPDRRRDRCGSGCRGRLDRGLSGCGFAGRRCGRRDDWRGNRARTL